mmetsp:Transcript_21135/g.60609  ORF Transcript_21135/g.60609 Transcript_21135/m.60609 type:complete len:298 (+) Transcript_21135:199-1092(+)
MAVKRRLGRMWMWMRMLVRTVIISASCWIAVIHGRWSSSSGRMSVALVLFPALGISWNGFGARLSSRCGCRRVVVIKLGGVATVTVVIIPIMAVGRRWGGSIPPFSVMSAVARIVRWWRRLRLAMIGIVVRRRRGSSVIAVRRRRWCVIFMRRRRTVMIQVRVVGIAIGGTVVGTLRRVVALFGVVDVVATVIGTPGNSQQLGLIDDALGPIVDVSEGGLLSLLANLVDVVFLFFTILGNLTFVDLTKALLALDVLSLLFVRGLLPHLGQKLGGIGIANSWMRPLDLRPLAVGVGQE